MNENENVTGAELARMDGLTELVQGLEGDRATGFSTVGISPYIWWPSRVSGLWESASNAIKGLQEYVDIVYVNGQEFVKLNPFKYVCLKSVFLYVLEDGQGQAYQTYSQRPAQGDPKEWFETVLIVFLADRAALARCRFARTKAGAIKATLAEVERASNDPNWLARPEAKVAASVANPDLRVITTCSCLYKVAKDRPDRNDPSRIQRGLPYGQASATCRPILADEILQIHQMLKSSTYQAEMAQIMADYNSNVRHLLSMKKD